MQRVILLTVVFCMSLSCGKQNRDAKVKEELTTVIEIGGYVKSPSIIRITLCDRVTMATLLNEVGGVEKEGVRANILELNGNTVVVDQYNWETPLVKMGVRPSKIKSINVQGR